MRLKKSGKYRKLVKKVKEGEILIIPSDDRLVTEYDPPYVAGPRKLPSWFRSSPKEGIRKCAGVRNFLEAGVIVPSWTTFSFAPDNVNGDWTFSYPNIPEADRQFSIEAFPYQATGSCPMTSIRQNERISYPKIITPYSFITAPGWSVIILGLLHEPNPNYDIISAIVHTDYYHQVNVVLNIKTDSSFKIYNSQPLFQLIPFKRSGDFRSIKFASEEYYKYSRFIDSDNINPLSDNGYDNIANEYRKLARRIND